jgi:uncharacterized protein (DUF1810 family)
VVCVPANPRSGIQHGERYALSSREEARAYHEHPLLGERLRECTRLVLGVEGRRIEQIFGYPDDLKFRSCMTLFAAVAPEEPIYCEALQRYFAGEPDPRTRASLSQRSDRQNFD